MKLSSSSGPKRSATSVLSRVTSSTNNVNGADVETIPTGEREARTLGLMNIPDTVNDARIRALVGQFGNLVKISLRPDHQGAIVEFSNVHDAGRASLELEGKEVGANRKLHVGTVPEMLKQRAEQKKDTTSSPSTTLLAGGGPVKRPGQPGSRGGAGRRGGLGVKRGGFPLAAHTTNHHHHDDNNNNDNDNHGAPAADGEGQQQAEGKKSNSDFRSLVEKSRAK